MLTIDQTTLRQMQLARDCSTILQLLNKRLLTAESLAALLTQPRCQIIKKK